MPRQGKAIWIKHNFPKYLKIFYQQVGEEGTRTDQPPNAKKAKKFWSKICE